jgi:hypothetical protein
MCKRGEDLARRSVHIDGGIKADWSGVEVIQVDGFAGEHTNSPCLRRARNIRTPPANHQRLSKWWHRSGWYRPRRRHRLAHGLFRREFSPTNNRNHDPDQRRDRTSDGPGCGVAHLATTKHSESLECPDQTEYCDDQPDRECNDESPSHIRILRAIWSASCEHVDR